MKKEFDENADHIKKAMEENSREKDFNKKLKCKYCGSITKISTIITQTVINQSIPDCFYCGKHNYYMID